MDTKPVARKAWTVKEAAESLGTSQYAIRKLIHEGQLRAIKIGESYHISDQQLEQYVNGRNKP